MNDYDWFEPRQSEDIIDWPQGLSYCISLAEISIFFFFVGSVHLHMNFIYG